MSVPAYMTQTCTGCMQQNGHAVIFLHPTTSSLTAVMDVETKPVDSDSVDQSVQDARDLATMGHDQALTRKFDLWSMLALAFCVLGTLLPPEGCWGIDAMDTKAGRNVFDFRARAQQRPHQRRPHHDPLGSCPGDGVQSLRGRVAGRVDEQHADGAGAGVLGVPAVAYTNRAVRLVPVCVDQHVRVVDAHGVADCVYDGVSAWDEGHV